MPVRLCGPHCFSLLSGRHIALLQQLNRIARLKKARSQLTKIDRSLLEDILETIDAPVVILATDGGILRFNKACERLTGYSAGEVVGRKVWDFLILDEEIGAVRSVFEQTRGDDTPTHFVNYWKTKNGGRRLIEWSNKKVEATKVYQACIIATGKDITEARSQEKALSESKAFLRSIVDASPVAIITTKDTGEILTFSRQAELSFGYDWAEVIGNNVRMLMPAYEQSRHDGFIERYLESGEGHIIGKARPVTALRRDGEEMPVILHVSEFQDDQRIFVAFIEDVTEQRKTERRLAETRDQLQHVGRLGAMGEIASSIAHELNQPLTAAASLVGAVSLTLKKADRETNRETAQLLDDAVDEIRRASEIIRNMREFVRKRKTARSLYDVNKVVEDACKVALIGADADGVCVTTDFSPKAGEMLLDRIQIQQVVTNLVRNAVDAMKETPQRELRISTARQNGYVEVRVEDTGDGISEEIEKHLFQPFVTSKEDGTGIGLSISKSIIDAHQGEIFGANKDSTGCVFAFRLPVSKNDLIPGP